MYDYVWLCMAMYDYLTVMKLMMKILQYFCVRGYYVWELSDNMVTIPLLLDAFQTYISYQHKILIIGKLLATVMMVGKLL